MSEIKKTFTSSGGEFKVKVKSWRHVKYSDGSEEDLPVPFKSEITGEDGTDWLTVSSSSVAVELTYDSTIECFENNDCLRQCEIKYIQIGQDDDIGHRLNEPQTTDPITLSQEEGEDCDDSGGGGTEPPVDGPYVFYGEAEWIDLDYCEQGTVGFIVTSFNKDTDQPIGFDITPLDDWTYVEQNSYPDPSDKETTTYPGATKNDTGSSRDNGWILFTQHTSGKTFKLEVRQNGNCDEPISDEYFFGFETETEEEQKEAK